MLPYLYFTFLLLHASQKTGFSLSVVVTVALVPALTIDVAGQHVYPPGLTPLTYILTLRRTLISLVHEHSGFAKIWGSQPARLVSCRGKRQKKI